MKKSSSLPSVLGMVISFQILSPSLLQAGEWFPTRSGAFIRIIDGDFSHQYYPDAQGYPDSSVENNANPQASDTASNSKSYVYHIDSSGKIGSLVPQVYSTNWQGGIEKVDIFPNNLSWKPAAKVLGLFVSQYLNKSTIASNPIVAAQALSNVRDISIPTLEVLAELTKKDRWSKIPKADLNKIKEWILTDPVAILVLAAEAKVSKAPSYLKDDVQNYARILVANREAKWIHFLRKDLIPEVLIYAEKNREWSFDHLRSAGFYLNESTVGPFIIHGSSIY